jgi:choline dehydrogenase-like flavoprotein
MVADHQYDVIIIGTGAGGATLAWRLAPSGKRILLLERGDFLPREQDNWDSRAVFVEAKYQAREPWFDKEGNEFLPGIHYFVGGNTKFYGSALLRLRREDFAELRHAGGISPAWPVGYEDFEPYYTAAERLYHVHGKRGADPCEPPAGAPYAYPPVSHEPRIAQLSDDLTRLGYHPYPLPLGILLDEVDGRPSRQSPCIRCPAFDGFPCITNGKADAQTICIEPLLAGFPNVTLLTGAYVERLETGRSGQAVSQVRVRRAGQAESYAAGIVVVACGAINSAALLLRSSSDRHPDGLANGSGTVGRHYLRHENTAFMAISLERNPTVFQKTLALSDFYFRADDWEYPLGLVQMLGKSDGAMIHAEAPGWATWAPEMPFDKMAEHSVDFWLSTEDLPDPDNRVTLDRQGRIVLRLKETNAEAHRRLVAKWQSLLGRLGFHQHLLPRHLYLRKRIPIAGTAHQAGTIRFGTDPRRSALDVFCKAHELDNLYVVDGSFFPSIGAVNPALTIMANALRVGDHLLQRLK